MGSQKSSTTTAFPQFMKTEMRNINKQARNLYDDPSKAMIPQLSNWTNQGLQSAAGIAQSGNTVAGAGTAEAMRILNGDYLDVTKNPAYQRNINDALGAVSQRFAGSGRVGSGSYAGTLADAATGTAAQMYNVERGRQMDALASLPNLVGAQYADAGALQDAGRSIDEQNMAQFDWPYAKLDRYANTVFGSPAAQNPGQNSSVGASWQNTGMPILSGILGLAHPLK